MVPHNRSQDFSSTSFPTDYSLSVYQSTYATEKASSNKKSSLFFQKQSCINYFNMFSRDITTDKSYTLHYEFRNIRNRATAADVLYLDLKFYHQSI